MLTLRSRNRRGGYIRPHGVVPQYRPPSSLRSFASWALSSPLVLVLLPICLAILVAILY